MSKRFQDEGGEIYVKAGIRNHTPKTQKGPPKRPLPLLQE
jgi:hypothetical protein